MDSLPILPPEILLYIATDLEIYYQLLAIPSFARYTIGPARPYIIDKYTIVKKHQYYTSYSIMYPSGIKLHRELLPAIIFTSGIKKWFKHGKLHREDGPAYCSKSGTKIWYRDDKLHREDGPAIEYADGTQKWYRKGRKHREDGPAVIKSTGVQKWYWKDYLHRDDGPAIEFPNGTRKWFRWGKMYSSVEVY